jgi:GDP-L-fucose synthase
MKNSDKILVTGAKGLVGSALVEHLIAKGFTNVITLGRHNCDLTDTVSTKLYFEKHKPTYVFHAAARVYGIMGNMKNKALSFYDNIMINTNVVDAAQKVGVKKITVMGTGAVYPYPSPGLPLKEEMIFMGEPHAAENSYAHAKRAMLAMLRAYEESYGMEWAYVVSCNLFGPRDKFDTEFGHVVPSLIKKFYDAKARGEQVVVWGNGSAKRDFMYVKDTACVSLAIMQGVNGPTNIGSGTVYSIRDIVDMIADITDMKNRVVWDETKPNGQDYRAYELTKINSIGFKCQHTIRQGLEETLAWYATNPQA